MVRRANLGSRSRRPPGAAARGPLACRGKQLLERIQVLCGRMTLLHIGHGRREQRDPLRLVTFGASVVLLDNGGDTLTISANGAFTFPKALDNSAAYAVTLGTQPS
jgi:hypothetical protein